MTSAIAWGELVKRMQNEDVGEEVTDNIKEKEESDSNNNN